MQKARRMRKWVPARLAELAIAGVKLKGPPPIEIEPEWAEKRYAGEPDGDADAIFQRRWALTVIEFTEGTLRAEYAARGEEPLFDKLAPFASSEPNEEERFAAAAAASGESMAAVRQAVFDFRTRQRELLRVFVGDTVADPADIESEITALRLVCGSAVAAPLPTVLRSVAPDHILADAIASARPSSAASGIWTPPSDAEITRLFPQYEMLGMLGRGGMGAVYRARQIELDRHVAIKLLPLEVSVDKEFADRFRREARAMAKLSHPHIIAVHDFGTTSEGHLYFSMEFVEGANLHQIIHSQGLAPKQALALATQVCDALATQVCDALAYAHGKGVVHRDIKPANVMIDAEGHVKVADFGLARLNGASPENFGMTNPGFVMGTPAYMAPEQTRGMDVDHRADIYSLGVMLYEMLCRETPQGVFDPPSKRVPVDVRVDQVVARAMAQQPERRYQSSTEMKLAVEHIRTAPMMRATPKTAIVLPPEKPRTALYLGLAAAIVAILSVVFWPKPKRVRQTRLAVATPAPPTPAPVPPTPTPAPVVARPEPAATPAPVVEEKMPEPPVVTAPPMPEVVLPGSKGSAEVVQWLAKVEAQHTAQYQNESAGPFEKALAALRAQYLGQVEVGSAAATKAGKLDDTLAWRNEQARLTAGQQPHDAPDEATEPASLRQLRENWRKAFARLDSERFARAKAVHQRFDALLDRGQTGFTQKDRLDDALLLKSKREEIRSAWLTPPVDLTKPDPLAAPKSPGTAMDAAKPAADLLAGRDAIAHLLRLVFNVDYVDGDGRKGTLRHDARIEELPLKGPYEITGLSTPGNGRAVSDADFAPLAPMRKLTSIEIKADITGSGVGFLAGSPDLTSVTIQSSALTDAALGPLLGLRKLGTLRLTDFTQPLSWSRLSELSALPHLTAFATSHAETIPPAVLARARNLQRLFLSGSHLTEEHFAAIGALPDLENFELGGQGDSGAAGLRRLEKCTKLIALDLARSPGLGAHFAFIGKMRKLTTLEIDGADAPELAAAAGAPALRAINLVGPSGSQGTTDEGLRIIAASFPRLESLLFRDSAARTLTADGLRALAKLPKLKTFNWGTAPLPLELAAVLPAFPALEHLSLRTGGLDETHVAELAKCKSLIFLDLSNRGVSLSPAAIEAFKPLRALRELNVAYSKHTPEQIAALRKVLPKCVVKGG